jgi:MFS family permease
MMGQAVGPVLGGIITQVFGFRAIFWFLLIIGSLTLLLILFFLPETHRGINKPLIYHVSEQSDVLTSIPPDRSRTRITLSSLVAPLRFLFEKDVFLTLFFGAVVYTVWSTVTSSTTALLQPRFHLSDLQTGLIFLPNGAGCVLGSWATGRLLDRDYHAVEGAYRYAHNMPADAPLDRRSAVDFPVARSRLRSAWWLVSVFCLAVAAYGFSASSVTLLAYSRGWALAVPLALQFAIAFAATAVFTQNSVLVVDLYPGASASATAVNNLIRCSLGALGVAVVQFIINALGAGLCFLAFALGTATLVPCLGAVWVWGTQWRADRLRRLEGAEAEKSEKGLC